MGDLAIRFDGTSGAAGDPLVWLPEEAPLAMPRQSLEDAPVSHEGAAATRPADLVIRRLALLTGTLFMTFCVSVGPVIMYARHGLTALELAGMAILLVLVTAISCWFTSAAIGLWVLMTGREQEDLAFAAHPPAPKTRTAILMPMYNEDAAAVFARLAALDASLVRLGAAEHFDIFVLSDSTKLETAAAEAAAYVGFQAQAGCRVFYRRRTANTEHKAGNIAEWTRRFGGAYDFMLVLDADSGMAGETVVRLVDAMERNTGVGLIQTTPTIIKASTLFARVSQFSVRLYGRVAAAGLAYWSGSDASYWGHNAIIRVKAFAACAGLPILPGAKPFGGNVLSHDVVEAAMLRRAGWGVHVTAALDGSTEETPPTVTDFIRRDHRWCQGNLQHLGLLRGKGFNRMSRLQFVLGCMAYVSSPLWLASLATGLAIQLQFPIDWASFWYFLNPEFSPFMLASAASAILLIGPKLMGGALVLSRPGERRAFGGTKQVVRGMAAEVAVSAILAPILMVANTKAVLQIVRGQDAGWQAQQRDVDGLSFRDAFRAMGWQMATGVAFTLALCFRPDLTAFFAPIVLPLLLSPWIAVWTSKRASGDAFAARGLLVIPDENAVTATTAVLPSRPVEEERRPVWEEAALRPAIAAMA